MKVLILSIYHDPEPIPKTGELARELQRRGHTVTVVTAFPHYPAGDLYPGYRLAPWRWEVRDGVGTLRTFIYPYHGRRSSLRMLNYLTWMMSSMQAAWLAPACDVLYVWHPPLTVGVSAWVIAKLKRVRFVYDVQDLWPESALASGLMRPGLLVRLLYRLSDWVYARADRIFVVSKAAAEHLQRRGVPRAKVVVAPHWVETRAFDGETSRNIRKELGWGSRFVAMFAGNIGMVQGLDTLLDAAAIVGPGEIDFVFVGDGSDRARLEQMAQARGLANVHFVGHHPASEMPAFLRGADVLLVQLRRSEIAEHAIPTKILSYLAAAKPIVAAVGGAAAELVTDAGAGIVVEPGDAEQLAAAVRRMAAMSLEDRDRLGRSGRTYLDTHLDKSAVIDIYERVLAQMARKPLLPAAEARQRS